MKEKVIAINVDVIVDDLLGDAPFDKDELVEYKKKREETKLFITKFFDQILTHVSAGRKVRVKNFGTFSCRMTKGLVRQPLTNKIVPVSDRKRIRFQSSTRAVSKINSKGN